MLKSGWRCAALSNRLDQAHSALLQGSTQCVCSSPRVAKTLGMDQVTIKHDLPAAEDLHNPLEGAVPVFRPAWKQREMIEQLASLVLNATAWSTSLSSQTSFARAARFQCS